MAYFPFFVDLEDKRGLIVGGGAVALRKAQKLLPYGPRLTAVAPKLKAEFRELHGVELLHRPFAETDLDGCAFDKRYTLTACNEQLKAIHTKPLTNLTSAKEDSE